MVQGEDNWMKGKHQVYLLVSRKNIYMRMGRERRGEGRQRKKTEQPKSLIKPIKFTV